MCLHRSRNHPEALARIAPAPCPANPARANATERPDIAQQVSENATRIESCDDAYAPDRPEIPIPCFIMAQRVPQMSTLSKPKCKVCALPEMARKSSLHPIPQTPRRALRQGPAHELGPANRTRSSTGHSTPG